MPVLNLIGNLIGIGPASLLEQSARLSPRTTQRPLPLGKMQQCRNTAMKSSGIDLDQRTGPGLVDLFGE